MTNGRVSLRLATTHLLVLKQFFFSPIKNVFRPAFLYYHGFFLWRGSKSFPQTTRVIEWLFHMRLTKTPLTRPRCSNFAALIFFDQIHHVAQPKQTCRKELVPRNVFELVTYAVFPV